MINSYEFIKRNSCRGVAFNVANAKAIKDMAINRDITASTADTKPHDIFLWMFFVCLFVCFDIQLWYFS